METKVIYQIVHDFYNWETRMKKICNEIPIKYLERSHIINQKKEKQLVKSWSNYFYFW